MLIAAEYPIYGRFGYGPAVRAHELGARRRRPSSPTPGAGTVEFVDNETFRKEAPAIFERVRLARPGHDRSRRPRLGRARRPPPPARGQAVDRASGSCASTTPASPRAGPTTTHKEHWVDMRPQATAEVSDLCAATPDAEARLWRFLAELDLVATVKAGDRPIDEVLPWLLVNGRAAKQTSPLRLRVGAAARRRRRLLTARAYTATGRVVARGRRRPGPRRRALRPRRLARRRHVRRHRPSRPS